jgi:hypothetical protein
VDKGEGGRKNENCEKENSKPFEFAHMLNSESLFGRACGCEATSPGNKHMMSGAVSL